MRRPAVPLTSASPSSRGKRLVGEDEGVGRLVGQQPFQKRAGIGRLERMVPFVSSAGDLTWLWCVASSSTSIAKSTMSWSLPSASMRSGSTTSAALGMRLEFWRRYRRRDAILMHQ